ncbi:unnamed protein product [Meganyctiphanes norvegica]|uniref:Ig-like domain-containing protein n=1 Tax=Meganyctiphanes norvegica TaxID=48144 RepID=A0AAV2S1T9_MEGNR
MLHTVGMRGYRWSVNWERGGNVGSWCSRMFMPKDDSVYRCKVDTNPPLTQDIILTVIEPRARVVDDKGTAVFEKHYNSGSMIELRCIIDRIPFPHAPVTWAKGRQVLSFNTSRGGISVKGDSIKGVVVTRLYVASASPGDSGNYSCVYGSYTRDSVAVHVIAGENSAFMQPDASPSSSSNSSSSSSLLVPGESKHVQLMCWMVLILGSFMHWDSCLDWLQNADPNLKDKHTSITNIHCKMKNNNRSIHDFSVWFLKIIATDIDIIQSSTLNNELNCIPLSIMLLLIEI